MELAAPSDRETMGGGDRDANAREAAGADADEDLSRGAASHELGDHRDQPLGMPAPDHFIRMRNARTRLVEQGGGAGGCGRVESQKHFRADSGHMRFNAASPRKSTDES